MKSKIFCYFVIIGIMLIFSIGITSNINAIPKRERKHSLLEIIESERKKKDRDKLKLDLFLGEKEYEPLLKGEPGGVIVGKGRDLKGQIRLARISHNLSSAPYSPLKSLMNIIDYLNEYTPIKADLNVEGGPVKITDANFQNLPVALFSIGHMIMSYIGHRVSTSRITSAEEKALRKYILESKGLIVIDMPYYKHNVQIIKALFRTILPNYSFERIRLSHEIFNNYYKMGGPLRGYEKEWHTFLDPFRRKKRLEGLFIDDGLRVLLFDRGYLTGLRKSLPGIQTGTRTEQNAINRFYTNVIFYALTHGSISDYSKYSPSTPESELDIELPDELPEHLRDLNSTPRQR